jgi:hypothetical protein
MSESLDSEDLDLRIVSSKVLYLPITSSPSSLGVIRRLPVCILPTTTSPLNPSLTFKWYTVNPAVFLDPWRLGRGDWQPHDCDEPRSAESGGVYRGVPLVWGRVADAGELLNRFLAW